MNILPQDVVGYLVRFLDVQTCGRLEIGSRFFCDGFVWANVIRFDKYFGFLSFYQSRSLASFDELVLKFAQRMTHLEHLEVKQGFIPLLLSTAHSLKSLVIKGPFIPESEKPLRAACSLLNPKILKHLDVELNLPNFESCDFFIELYKDLTESPLEELRVFWHSHPNFTKLLQQIQKSTGSLRTLSLRTYEKQKHSPLLPLQQACQRNTALRSLNVRDGSSDRSKFIRLLLPNWDEIVELKDFGRLEEILRKNYVVGLSGLTFNVNDSAFTCLVSEPDISLSEIEDMFDRVYPIEAAPNCIVAASNEIAEVMATRRKDPKLVIWLSTTFRKIVEIAIDSSSYDLQDDVFRTLCRFERWLLEFEWLLTVFMKTLISHERRLFRNLEMTPDMLARLLLDEGWVNAIQLCICDDTADPGMAHRLYGHEEAFNAFIRLPGFDPASRDAKTGATVVEYVFSESRRNQGYDSRIVPLLETMQKRHDLLMSVIQNEAGQTALLKRAEYVLAFIKAFEGVEPLLHADIMWIFLQHDQLDTLRKALGQMNPDANQYEEVVVPEVADALWRVAISRSSDPVSLCFYLCTALSTFPYFPAWADDILDDDASDLPIPAQIPAEEVKEIIRNMIQLLFLDR